MFTNEACACLSVELSLYHSMGSLAALPMSLQISKNIDCLSFVVCHIFQGICLFFSFFAAAISSTNEANKAGDMHH
jgi:hypothetical protein